MRCIRQGMPWTGLQPDKDVGEALQACAGSSGLEAVSKMVLLGSAVRSLTSAQQEIPYSCGDMIDVVTTVCGDLHDALELRDSCPLPRLTGNAVSVVVETAREIVGLARDSLEQACIDACETEEPLVKLAGRIPLQALLLAQRCSLEALLEQAIQCNGDLSEVVQNLHGGIAAVDEELKQSNSERQSLALQQLQSALSELESTINALAATPSMEERRRLWEDEMRFHFCKEKKEFRCYCVGISIPMTFEYNPVAHIAKAEHARLFRRAFANAFNPSAGKTEGPSVLVIDGPPEVASAELLRSTCALIGTIPVVLKGSELSTSDTFWSRAAAAAKAFAVGSLPVLGVEDAALADAEALSVALQASSEHRFALCIFSSAPLRKLRQDTASKLVELSLVSS